MCWCSHVRALGQLEHEFAARPSQVAMQARTRWSTELALQSHDQLLVVLKDTKDTTHVVPRDHFSLSTAGVKTLLFTDQYGSCPASSVTEGRPHLQHAQRDTDVPAPQPSQRCVSRARQKWLLREHVHVSKGINQQRTGDPHCNGITSPCHGRKDSPWNRSPGRPAVRACCTLSSVRNLPSVDSADPPKILL